MDNQFLSIEPKKDTALIHKRQIERGVISKAIYMVTDLFNEGEPLKSALRALAVNLLKDDKAEDVLKLKNLLNLSAEVGIASEANIKILLQAISDIKPLITRDDKSLDLQGMFLRSDAEANASQVADNNSILHNDVEKKGVESSGSVREDRTTKIVHPKDTPLYTSVIRSNAASLREELQKHMSQKQPVSTATTLDIGTRRKKILEVVKAKGQVTIHEFIQSIQGCSSKTIQRELTSLVLSGTLKKTGERRWSKYSLR